MDRHVLVLGTSQSWTRLSLVINSFCYYNISHENRI